MASSYNSRALEENLSKYKPENLPEIIYKLSGGKSNIKVVIEELKFSIGKTKYEVNGDVNFLVKHKKSEQ
jgi:hypothetical protein